MGISALSDIGDIMVKLLAKHLVPDVVPSADNIGMCSPDEHGDYRLGLFLYSVSENEQVVRPGMVNAGLERQSYPSTFVDLSFMITAYSSSDIKYRAAEEQRILGRVVQVLRDYSVLTEAADRGGAAPRITLLSMEQNEKFRMWNFPNVPFKMSLYYQVGPVEIESGRTKDVVRVKNVDFTMQERT